MGYVIRKNDQGKYVVVKVANDELPKPQPLQFTTLLQQAGANIKPIRKFVETPTKTEVPKWNIPLRASAWAGDTLVNMAKSALFGNPQETDLKNKINEKIMAGEHLTQEESEAAKRMLIQDMPMMAGMTAPISSNYDDMVLIRQNYSDKMKQFLKDGNYEQAEEVAKLADKMDQTIFKGSVNGIQDDVATVLQKVEDVKKVPKVNKGENTTQTILDNLKKEVDIIDMKNEEIVNMYKGKLPADVNPEDVIPGGVYSKNVGEKPTIRLNKEYLEKTGNYDARLYHELGHYVWKRKLTADQQREFLKNFDLSKESKLYGDKGAELFSAYFTNWARNPSADSILRKGDSGRMIDMIDGFMKEAGTSIYK